MADRKDPMESYNFTVEIDGLVVAGFKELSGIESRIEVVEYRDGEDKLLPARKLPGKVTYANLVLRAAISQDKTLFNWHMDWVKGAASAKRKSIRIALLDRTGQVQLSWKIREAWPVAYIGPTFNAESSLVALQTLEIAHEGIELE
jgi:phage tail-like protein